MTEYTIRPLAVGINQTDQGIMTYQRGYGTRILLPVYSFLIQGNDLNVLVDTGMEEFMVPPGAREALGFPILEFEEALGSAGLKPDQIDLVIQTHLHNDHCENTGLCRRARIVVQRAEHEFAQDPHPLDHRYFPELTEGLDLELVEGDMEIVPGIELLFTPGHTPGGQSVAVNTSTGKAIITGFCCNAKNFPETGPVAAPGVHTDAIAAYDSTVRVKELADIILPNHDQGLGTRGVMPG